MEVPSFDTVHARYLGNGSFFGEGLQGVEADLNAIDKPCSSRCSRCSSAPPSLLASCHSLPPSFHPIHACTCAPEFPRRKLAGSHRAFAASPLLARREMFLIPAQIRRPLICPYTHSSSSSSSSPLIAEFESSSAFLPTSSVILGPQSPQHFKWANIAL